MCLCPLSCGMPSVLRCFSLHLGMSAICKEGANKQHCEKFRRLFLFPILSDQPTRATTDGHSRRELPLLKPQYFRIYPASSDCASHLVNPACSCGALADLSQTAFNNILAWGIPSRYQWITRSYQIMEVTACCASPSLVDQAYPCPLLPYLSTFYLNG